MPVSDRIIDNTSRMAYERSTYTPKKENPNMGRAGGKQKLLSNQSKLISIRIGNSFKKERSRFLLFLV